MADVIARGMAAGAKADVIALAGKNTLQYTVPTAAISDGGIHIVILESEPATKYDGYIYFIED